MKESILVIAWRLDIAQIVQETTSHFMFPGRQLEAKAGEEDLVYSDKTLGVYLVDDGSF